MDTDIDIKDVSLMDVSTWHQSVDDYGQAPSHNQEIAEWLLWIRNAAQIQDQGTDKHIDVIRSNQLLKLLASNSLSRHCILSTDANVARVIESYEKYSRV